jgi:hypothetical protein
MRGPCAASRPTRSPRLCDVMRKCNLLHIVGYSVSEQNGDWTITRIFSGSLTRMQAQYGLKYPVTPRPDARECAGLEALERRFNAQERLLCPR